MKVRELRDKYGPIFRAGMGAEAILEILSQVDQEELWAKLQQEVQTTAGQRRKKATKRLRVVEAFRKSGNMADWMILSVLPVLPPDLRPMVQLTAAGLLPATSMTCTAASSTATTASRRLMELGARISLSATRSACSRKPWTRSSITGGVAVPLPAAATTS